MTDISFAHQTEFAKWMLALAEDCEDIAVLKNLHEIAELFLGWTSGGLGSGIACDLDEYLGEKISLHEDGSDLVWGDHALKSLKEDISRQAAMEKSEVANNADSVASSVAAHTYAPNISRADEVEFTKNILAIAEVCKDYTVIGNLYYIAGLFYMWCIEAGLDDKIAANLDQYLYESTFLLQDKTDTKARDTALGVLKEEFSRYETMRAATEKRNREFEQFYDQEVLPRYELFNIANVQWKSHGRIGNDIFAHSFRYKDENEDYGDEHYILVFEDFPSEPHVGFDKNNRIGTKSGETRIHIDVPENGTYEENKTGYFTLYSNM